MARKFKELRDQMSPERQKRSEAMARDDGRPAAGGNP